jgi:DNA repair photolyase
MSGPPPRRPGRGALSSPPGRFARTTVAGVDDGWATPGALDGDADPADANPDSVATSLTPEHARSIITRNESPDIAFDQSINPYRGCEHGCVYCLDGGTRILMADGGTRPLAGIAIGDRIVGTRLRRVPPSEVGLEVAYERCYVLTEVRACWRTRQRAWRLRLADGTELIASAEHRFLAGAGWKHVAEASPGSTEPCLERGDRLAGFGVVPRALVPGTPVAVPARLAVVAIEPLDGVRELVDITTGSGDFIANGVVSHNCYARPSHAYVDLSPGLDFETRLFYKVDAARLLEAELAKPGYVTRPIMLGANTDPYQPVEKQLGITRSLLEVMVRCRHPVMIVTKGALLERDIDLLADLARDGLARVTLSLPTLDVPLKRLLEPRAASAAARLRLMRQLKEAGVPVGVLVAPVIPVLTDHEIERLLEASAAAGASSAGYVMLRLPHEVKTLFREWLGVHFPGSAAHVMARVADLRAGRDNDPAFGSRMTGQGAFAALVRQRFKVACRRLGLQDRYDLPLPTHLFRRPERPCAAGAGQLKLDF